MKVLIKDLKANPFRDIENYPIDEEKVKALKASYKQTGYWGNIVGRKTKDSTWEIAFGHHRLEALRQYYKGKLSTEEIQIIVRNFSDEEMLQAMAAENMDVYKALPSVIEETIRKTREFLNENPDIKAKYIIDSSSYEFVSTYSIEVQIIAKFLSGYDLRRVRSALSRIEAVNDKIVNSEALKAITVEGAAEAFVEAIKRKDKAGKKPSATTQKRVAEKYEKGEVKLTEFEKEFELMEIWKGQGKTERQKWNDRREKQFESFEDYAKEISDDGDAFLQKLKIFTRLRKDLPHDLVPGKQSIYASITLRSIAKQIAVIETFQHGNGTPKLINQ